MKNSSFLWQVSGYLALWYEKTYYLCDIRLKYRRYEKSSYSI